MTSPPVTATVQIYGDALVVNTTLDEPDLDPADGICFTGDLIATGEPACSLRAAVEEANARGVPAVIVLGAGNHTIADSSVVADIDVTIVGAGSDTTSVSRAGGVLRPLVLNAGASVSSLGFEGYLDIESGTSVDLVDVDLYGILGNVFVRTGGVLAASRVSDAAVGAGSGIFVTGGVARHRRQRTRNNRGERRRGRSLERHHRIRQQRGRVDGDSDGTIGEAVVHGGKLCSSESTVEDRLRVRAATPARRRQTSWPRRWARSVGGPGGRPRGTVASTTVIGDVTGLEAEFGIESSTIGGRVMSSGVVPIERSAIGNSTGACTFSGSSTTTLTDNVDVDGSCGGGAVGDLLLGPLADNGGPTLTYLPLPGSPLVDAAGNGCPASDQRGAPRPIDGDDDTAVACDAGAVEAPSGSGGPTPPATIEFDITFAGAPVDDEPFEVDVDLVAPLSAVIVERVPLAVDPGWPEASSGCSGGLLDSTGERPTCSGTFTIEDDSVVDVEVVATNSGVSPYPTFAGDCAGGALTVGRGVALTCTITFVRPDIGDSDPAESAILRLDKRWVAPLATEPPDATIGVDVLFGGFTADIPVGELRDGSLSADRARCRPTASTTWRSARPARPRRHHPRPRRVEEELPDGWQAFFGDDCHADQYRRPSTR